MAKSANKPQAQAEKPAGKSVPTSQIETLIQGHQQNLANLKARRAQIVEQLEEIEEAVKRTEGAIFGLSTLLQPSQEQAPAQEEKPVLPEEQVAPQVEEISPNGVVQEQV